MNDPLDAMILKLVSSAPLRWAELNYADLTANEEEALALLTAAGLIERRFSVRISMIGHSVRLDITGTATGEYGFIEALAPLLTICGRITTTCGGRIPIIQHQASSAR